MLSHRRRSPILALLALAACVAPTTAAAAARPVSVSVQGDSLSVLSRAALIRTLGGDGAKVVSYSAQIGRHTDAGLGLLRTQRLGRVVVFALGTNDHAASSAWYKARLTKMMHMVGPKRCVVLSTAYARGPATGINHAIATARHHYGSTRIQVADWSRAVRLGHVHLPDGVHPTTSSGAHLRASLIAAAAHRCATALRDGASR
jgi:predicted secreted Zn-dependent protease